MRFFETIFMEEAREFIKKLDKKAARKVLYNIDLSEQTKDIRLFKKIHGDIWEFRTLYSKTQIRLLAFWDRTVNKDTLVIATHGFVKKVDKIPDQELRRAENLKRKYFENKIKSG